MQDLKRQSNRRPVVRKFRSSPMTVRKNRSNPIPGLSIKLRKTNSEPGFSNYWLPSYFVKNEPAFLRKKIRFLVNKFVGILGLVFFLWLAGGSVWVGKAFFKYPIKKVFINGEILLREVEILYISGIQPGQILSSLKPYQIVDRLQKHAGIKNADIRLKFPDEIHLYVNEYRPVALLRISKSDNTIRQDYLDSKNYFLIGKNQRIIKKLSEKQVLNSKFNKLPLISGFKTNTLIIGSLLNSPVLERGLKFLETINKIAIKEKETEKFFNNSNNLATLDYKKIHIDLSDPLNLKIKWNGTTPLVKIDHSKNFQNFPLTIQMGSRNFGERLDILNNIYPVLYRQHPRLKSIDLRYKNKVMLIP